MTEWKIEPKVAAANIRRLRKVEGLTQEELAHAAQLSPKTIENLENGKTCPTDRTYAKIARALNTSAEEFAKAIEDEAPLMEKWATAIVERYRNTSKVLRVSLGMLAMTVSLLTLWISSFANIDVNIERELRASETEVVDWGPFVTVEALWIVDVFNHSEHPEVITDIVAIGFNKDLRQATSSEFNKDPKIDREKKRPITVPAGEYRRFELRVPIPVSNRAQGLAKRCQCTSFEELRKFFKARQLGDLGYPINDRDGNGIMLFIDLADGEKIYAQADWNPVVGR